MLIPPVRVRDDFALAPSEYVISLRDGERARGQVRGDALLAIPAQPDAPPLPGDETREPIFGLKAWWIQPDHRLQAETRGYTVVEPAAVIATHLSETIRRNAAEILSRQDVADLVEQVRSSEPAVVTELIPDLAVVGQVHQALRQLLDEGLSIRDLPAILEALTDGLRLTQQLNQAVEYVRMTQAEAICERLCDSQRVIHAASLSPALEALVGDSLIATPEGNVCALPPDAAQQLLSELGQLVQQVGNEGHEPVLVTSPQTRPHVRGAIARSHPQVRVISYAEIAPQIKVEVVRQFGTAEPVLQVA
jgi:flagellar biosynthesis protein FlhA